MQTPHCMEDEAVEQTDPVETRTAPPARSTRRIAWRVLVVLLMVIYAGWLLLMSPPAIFTPDANGYWAQGVRLARTGTSTWRQDSPVQYVGVHWLMTPSDTFISRYPPGLSTVVAAAWTVAGPRGAALVNPALAVLSIIGLYLVLHRLTGPVFALAGCVVLAMNPTFIGHALACDAHVAVLCLLTWGLWLLMRWSVSLSLFEAATAGLVLGLIPTVRYPEAVFGLGVGVFMLWRAGRDRRAWLGVLVAVVAAALPMVVLMIRNKAVLGSALATGYSLTGEQTGFGWSYFRQHVFQYIGDLNGTGLGLVFVPGLIGMTAMLWRRRLRRLGVLLLLMVVPLTLLYMAYYWGRSGRGTMRFLLPTWPAYIIGGMWLLDELIGRRRRSLAYWSLGIVVVLQVLWGLPEGLGGAAAIRSQKARLATVTDALYQHTGRQDVVLGSNALLQHLDYVGDWKLVEVRSLQGQLGGGRPRMRNTDEDGPAVMQHEKIERLSARYRDMTPWQREEAIVKDLRQWAGDGTVYFVGTEDELERLRGRYFTPEAFTVVARVKLPEEPAFLKDRRAGRPGGPGGPDGPGRPGGPDAQRRPGGPDGPEGDRSTRRRPGGEQPDGPARRRRPGGGGGPGRGFASGAEEVIIATWTWREGGYPTERRPRPRRGGLPFFRM